MGAQTSRASHEDVPPDFYDSALRTNLIQRLWHKRRLQRIAALISKTNGRILDIGCDGITLTEAVAARAAAKEVVGIDILGKAVAYSKRKRPDFHLAIGHGEQLPFREAAFDVIVCLEVLEHVEHPDKLLSEMKRCLKMDGYALLMVPTETPLFRLLWFLWTRLGKGRVWRHAHVQEFRGELLDRLVSEAGFRVVENSVFMLGMLRAIKISSA
jgi:2-polyprenyl-6-hydroxyphenyl methylase/3-demethylubiquinone-9 3-methyltransferase